MAKKTKSEVQKDIQGFMRTLLADTSIATLFLKSPQEVAKRFGIVVSAKDANRIKASLETIVTGKIPVADDCSWHDFPECDHIAKGVRPGEEIIKSNMERIRKVPTRKIIASDCSWHDFPECDSLINIINPVRDVVKPIKKPK